MKMTVADLRKALEGVPDEYELVFQANDYSAKDVDVDGNILDPSYTVSTGSIYSAWTHHSRKNEFILDCAAEWSEN